MLNLLLIKLKMIENGKTAEMLASEIGVCYSTVMNFLAGRNQLHIKKLEALAKAIKVKQTDLILKDGSKRYKVYLAKKYKENILKKNKNPLDFKN